MVTLSVVDWTQISFLFSLFSYAAISGDLPSHKRTTLPVSTSSIRSIKIMQDHQPFKRKLIMILNRVHGHAHLFFFFLLVLILRVDIKKLKIKIGDFLK